MIKTPHFFDDEREAPLLARNFRFVTAETSDAVTARVRSLKDLLGAPAGSESTDVAPTTNEEMLRIFRKDAERTYVEKTAPEMQQRTLARQNRHVEILAKVVGVVQDYHQGMGYIAAFLGLFLDNDEVVHIMLQLHREPKFSAGYFSATPTRFVADGRVLMSLMTSDEDLMGHLAKFGILPEMYMSKWFIGLCLHVLPFQVLVAFYEQFFVHGNSFLFAFGLAYLRHFRASLLAAKSTSALMTILRAEDDTADWKLPKFMRVEEDFEAILADAINGLDKLPDDLEDRRDAEFAKVAEQVRKAKERDEELKRLYADEDDDDNWSDE